MTTLPKNARAWIDSEGAQLFKSAFTPNEPLSKKLSNFIILFYFVTIIGFWALHPSKIFPNPLEVLIAFPELWFNKGLGVELYTSLVLNIQAISITTLISLLISYSAAIPALKPTSIFVSLFRFNGFVGLPLLLTFLLGNHHQIKIALLVIGMSVFTVPSIISMIDLIPKEAYDHGRVLRMNEWQILWEVVILGKFHEVIDILRTNFAIGWMMLPMVEGLFRSEGGIGVMILIENKWFKLEAIYAIIITVMIVGLLQDYVLQLFKKLICPYAFINTEKK